jgi:hypothetical protein
VCGQNPWPAGSEPSVDELLSDPIAVALLRSDGLTRRNVDAAFAQARRNTISVAAKPPARRSARPHRTPRISSEFDFDAEPELTLTE